ncbi:MAG: hypothetical protein DMG58_18570 [Acidobacteria bacterium]|nr:MAG: hypothetical protein DMG58_18570 [Acidobacteriota bacterium]
MKFVTAGIMLLCSGWIWAQPQRNSLDYPLALNTRWTYHLHQENGPGVHFGEDLAALAKDNVVDTSVISEVAGVETIGGHSYTRVESRINGKPWLFEWERVSPEGLLVGKTREQEGPEVTMEPEQKRISATLRPGAFWEWQAKDAPIKFRYTVVGPGAVDVPVGHYQGVHLTATGSVQAPFGKVDIRQETWFVSGVGIAKQETETSVQGHKLSGVLLTLEKFEK